MNILKNHKIKSFFIMLFPIALIINLVAANNPNLVEKYYTLGINVYIVKFLSSISSMFNYSLFEITVYTLLISIVATIVITIYFLIKQREKRLYILKTLTVNILCIASTVYFLFIILWGINYNRVPLEDTLKRNLEISKNTEIENQLKDKKLDRELGKESKDDNTDLINLYSYLIDKSNETRQLVLVDKKGIMKNNSDYKNVIERASKGYNSLEKLEIIPGIKGNYPNAKYILSSNLMSYTGITGIYFPFTGEANVNIDVPDFTLPATVSHEMAHQRGFASEDEANFIAYLSSTNNPDADFRYSGYTLALMYTSTALRETNYDEYVKLSEKISDDVRRDLAYNNEYWADFEGNIDEISSNLNNTYLKSNGVENGTKNYGQMVELLLIYYGDYKLNEKVEGDAYIFRE